MEKLKSRKAFILYGCSGLGVNMLNLIVGSYLCSALLTGGFDKNIEQWTYINKDLVVAGLWGILVFVAKVVDGLIDIPLSSFADNLRTKLGRRKSGILLGFIPMIVAYLLFLVPINSEATLLNTIWFAALLFIFYGAYTLTMITYYATFAEVINNKTDLMTVSNTKSICDVVYFSLGYALVPAFVSMGVNIRYVALIFLPLSLTMLIPFILLKEKPGKAEDGKKTDMPRITLGQSLSAAFKCTEFIKWLVVLCIMNFGLQLFLSGINEFFSTTGLNMTFVMASCFVPVPATIFLYNKIVKTKGLGFAYRYILLVYSVGMALMYFCKHLPQGALFPFAIGCSLIVSFSIGAFFAVTYTVPSHIAAKRRELTGEDSTSTMFFAVQGLFEGASAGIASGIVLVYLKQSGNISYMTLIVAAACMAAFTLSFLLPKSISTIGKE